jgi:hypothetical protein
MIRDHHHGLNNLKKKKSELKFLGRKNVRLLKREERNYFEILNALAEESYQ